MWFFSSSFTSLERKSDTTTVKQKSTIKKNSYAKHKIALNLLCFFLFSIFFIWIAKQAKIFQKHSNISTIATKQKKNTNTKWTIKFKNCFLLSWRVIRQKNVEKCHWKWTKAYGAMSTKNTKTSKVRYKAINSMQTPKFFSIKENQCKLIHLIFKRGQSATHKEWANEMKRGSSFLFQLLTNKWNVSISILSCWNPM